MKKLILAFALVLLPLAANAQTLLSLFTYHIGGASGSIPALPAASGMKGKVVDVDNARTPGDCRIGGGTMRAACRSDGTKWVAWGATNREVLVDDYGAVGNGSTDDQSSINSAVSAVSTAGGGRVIFTPGLTYASSRIAVYSNVVIDLNRSTIKAITSAANELFEFGNNPTSGGGGLTPISLSSATKGGTSITVSSSSAFVVGERIMISAGTFSSSGVEEGPIEYNTVASKPDGTHITVKTPLKYTYSASALGGAGGGVGHGIYRIESTGGFYVKGYIHDIRITNGTLKSAGGGNNALYFNGSGERIEIDHLYVQDLGSEIATGGYLSQLNVHDNTFAGPTNLGGSGATWGTASMVESRFVNNDFISETGINRIVLEVTCRDNLIIGNRFNPSRTTSSGAIEITAYGFNNTIINNTVEGVAADITSGVATLGIRTYGQGAMAETGNIIAGNHIRNIGFAVGDVANYSQMYGNVITIDSGLTPAATTVGFVTDTGKGTFGSNTISGPITYPYINSLLTGVPAVRFNAGAPASIFWGNGSPETVVTANRGSIYMRLDGGTGTTQYLKESGTGNTGWTSSLGSNVALSSLGATATASSNYPGFVPSFINDGNRKANASASIGSQTFWNDNTASTFDDWVQIDFSGSSIIGEIDVFTTNDSAVVEPTATDTFSSYGITNFTVQYWNGSSWIDLKTITGNTHVWTKLLIPGAISTTKIRVVVHDTADHLYSRIAEVEAWTSSGLATIADSAGGAAVTTSRTLTAGAGLTGGGDLSADRTFALTTPGTLTVSTSNSASGNHTHAITSSSNPGAAASILATDSSGSISIVGLTVTPISGQTITVEGVTINAQTGTSYTIVAGDNGKLLTLNNASAISVTLPQATGSFTTGWTIYIGTIGAGTATITPTTSTINATALGGSSSASSITITTGHSVKLVSNGTNYVAYNDAGRY